MGLGTCEIQYVDIVTVMNRSWWGQFERRGGFDIPLFLTRAQFQHPHYDTILAGFLSRFWLQLAPTAEAWDINIKMPAEEHTFSPSVLSSTLQQCDGAWSWRHARECKLFPSNSWSTEAQRHKRDYANRESIAIMYTEIKLAFLQTVSDTATHNSHRLDRL